MSKKNLVMLLDDCRDKALSLHAETLGMHPTRWRVLDFLAGFSEPVRQIVVINKTGVDRSSLSAMLRAMRRDGLVIMETDPDDERARLVSLSAPGRALHTTVQRRTAKADTRIEARYKGLRSALERFLAG